MILLALSSSGPFPSAALCIDGKLKDYRQGETGHTHSETLMPLLDALLFDNGVSPDQIDVYAADVGPGSFTGVRIGVCAVNAMARAHQKKLIAVSALEALCYGISRRVCAMLDARNRSVYTAIYENGSCLFPPTAAALEDCLAQSEGCALFVGDGAEVYREAIESKVMGSRCQAACLRADHVALLAHAHWKNGEAVDEILPLYLRPSQAERLFEVKHGEHTVS